MASAWGDSWGDAWGDAWGEQAPGTTQAGYRSLLAPWLGGGVAGVTPGPAVRSLLAPWMGGAAAGAAPTTQAAYKSLLAPWMGGAVLGEEVVVPPVEEDRRSARHLKGIRDERVRLPHIHAIATSSGVVARVRNPELVPLAVREAIAKAFQPPTPAEVVRRVVVALPPSRALGRVAGVDTQASCVVPVAASCGVGVVGAMSTRVSARVAIPAGGGVGVARTFDEVYAQRNTDDDAILALALELV